MKVFDRRLVTSFKSLTEHQEYAICNSIIEYLYYYSTILKTTEVFEAASAFNYYNNIMKPYSIELMLQTAEVQIDTIVYMEKYYNSIVFLKKGTGNPLLIDKTRQYNRALYIDVMRNLIQQNMNNSSVRSIISYLEAHRINYKNISDDYIIRIVDKIFKLI